MSYIFSEKVSSLIHTEMIVSDFSLFSDFFSSIVYCLPSTRASIRVGEKLSDRFDSRLGDALDRWREFAFVAVYFRIAFTRASPLV